MEEFWLVRGEGGMTVTLGLMDRESLSLSDIGTLLTETFGLWFRLALEMDMVGWRGEVGDGLGDRAPSRCVLVFTSFEKKLGAMRGGRMQEC